MEKIQIYINYKMQIFIISNNSFVVALALFGTKIYESSTVYLTDNVGTCIPQNLFMDIIKNFWNGSNFYVEIKYTNIIRNNNCSNDLVLPEVKISVDLIFSIFKYLCSCNFRMFLHCFLLIYSIWKLISNQ